MAAVGAALSSDALDGAHADSPARASSKSKRTSSRVLGWVIIVIRDAAPGRDVAVRIGEV